MEHKATNNANRGNRKAVTLLLMGNESEVIHPLYLHATSGGRVRGLAVNKKGESKEFAMSLGEFHKIDLNVVKGLG